jgi:DNA-binding transcriptional MerR regulator
MGEVAEMLDVTPTLLRFWEKQFDIIAPAKNGKGNRLFTPADVRNLKTIYHLVKEKGMTLAGAEKQLKARRGKIERDMEIAERLASIRALLVEVRNELGGGGTIVDDYAAEETVPVAAAASGEEYEAVSEPRFVEQTLF